MSIKIITDSACDLPYEFVRENNIKLASLSVNIKGEFIKDDLGQTLKYEEFYKLIRNGEKTSTSQVNVYTFEELFKEEIIAGNDVIYIGLASVLSGTLNSAMIAKENILEKFPKAKIEIIDSKSVTLGEGLLVYYAQAMVNNRVDYEEIIEWIKNAVQRIQHSIVLDDLDHLKRGGRISSTTAIVGSILGVKPTLLIDKEGNLFPGPKLKGRKRAMNYLINELEHNGLDIENQVIFIAHSDCEEDAEIIKNRIMEKFTVKNIIINNIGTIIGTHAGPDALAIFYLGKER